MRDSGGAKHLPVSPLTCNHGQGHVPADCPVAHRDSAAVLPCITRPHHGEMQGEASAAQILGDVPVLQMPSCKVAPVGCHHIHPKGTGKVAQSAREIGCRASCSIDHRLGWAVKTCARERRQCGVVPGKSSSRR